LPVSRRTPKTFTEAAVMEGSFGYLSHVFAQCFVKDRKNQVGKLLAAAMLASMRRELTLDAMAKIRLTA
jgi:hypothetical protein